MLKQTKKIKNRLLLWAIAVLLLSSAYNSYSQQYRWLHVTDLQSFINEVGAEYESEGQTGNTNFFSWPAQYSIDQNAVRMRGMWIGCHNFDDPVENKVKSVKVIGSGPRDASDRVNQIFEQEIKLIGKPVGQYDQPMVIVDDQPASSIDAYDELDEVDENLAADRMVFVKFNTSIGISVTKKVMVFDHPNHGNYFIHDYVFKNTGIYNRQGDVQQQTLEDVWFYFFYRYAFAGVSSSGWGSTWGAFSSTWGASTVNHAFGQDPSASEFNDPNSLLYQLRGFYSWYYPNADRPVSFVEDWGCPNESEDGTLGSAKYAGCVTLHADKSSNDKTDDLNQPATTWFIGSDITATLANVSQYDEIFMSDRYAIMSEGYPDKPHNEYVGDDYPTNYTDPRRQTGGGTSQGQGYGPYTLAPGDSIHIVFAEGISGLSWAKGREIGAKWLQWWNNTGQPELVMPNGTTTTDYNLYKRRWCETGRDSILQLYQNAKRNYESGYNIPQPPPPPEKFTVTSGGDRINLSWSDNASNWPHFDGYVIYRSEGNVLDWRTKYEKIFECNEANVVYSFSDTSASRGFDYYYYIQSKDDGTQNDLEPGKPLYSSLHWTLTTIPANLQRLAADFMDELRVVPNPYDIRARLFQFGDQSQYDRIAFYGLPPICKVKIFTESGELIWEKDHTNYSGDELWDSKTSSGQIVVSGIYILYIEVTEDIYASEDRYASHDIYDDNLNLIYRTGDLLYRNGDLIFRKGESKFRKFVIIR